jgi:hypothetical protein
MDTFSLFSFFLNLKEWWNVLSLEYQIFYFIGLLSTFILFVQTLLLLVMGDGDASGDVDLDVPADAGVVSEVKILSAKAIIAFFVGFGWSGVLMLKSGFTLGPAITVATVVGGSFMSVVIFMMRALYGLRSSGNIHLKNAIGAIGSVYVSIPSNRTGAGQVEITIQSRLRFVEALTDAEESIPSHSRVRVVDAIDPVTLLVEPLQEKPKEEK